MATIGRGVAREGDGGRNIPSRSLSITPSKSISVVDSAIVGGCVGADAGTSGDYGVSGVTVGKVGGLRRGKEEVATDGNRQMLVSREDGARAASEHSRGMAGAVRERRLEKRKRARKGVRRGESRERRRDSEIQESRSANTDKFKLYSTQTKFRPISPPLRPLPLTPTCISPSSPDAVLTVASSLTWPVHAVLPGVQHPPIGASRTLLATQSYFRRAPLLDSASCLLGLYPTRLNIYGI